MPLDESLTAATTNDIVVALPFVAAARAASAPALGRFGRLYGSSAVMGLTAWIQGRAFRMNAVAVFIALLFFGWLWGGWGLLVGVPLLAIAKTTIDRIPSLQRFITLLAD